METFTRDVLQILRLIGAQDRVNYTPKNVKSHTLYKSYDYYQSLLKDVEADILEQFLRRYELDFRLFGYDIEPFERIVREKRENN